MGNIFINLTAKPIHLTYEEDERDDEYRKTGKRVTRILALEPSGTVAKVLYEEKTGDTDGIPVYRQMGVEGLPDEEADKWARYIVDREVLSAAVGRFDVFALAADGSGLIARNIDILVAEARKIRGVKR